jgi:hypothetical protein
MGDLRNPRLMYLKAVLLLAAGMIAAGGIILETRSWKIAVLLAVSIWGFARAYYFAFYVIEHYIDDEYKFAGLGSFVRYLWKRGRTRRGR